MHNKTPYYITTPIYYVNDKPHIGHAYTTLACDVIARFMRLDGREVIFSTGTDEYGQKVEKSAKKKNMDPLSFVNDVSENFKDLTKKMNFSNDQFIRTTETRHIKAAQEIWKTLMDKNQIYLGEYQGWYSVRDEAFYNEDELTVNENGQRIAPTNAEVEWVKEPSYFFRLSEWGDKLLQFYEDNPNFIAPKSRRNEVISFVKQGLRDLSISRTSFKWGVQVPDNQDHVIYVWLDALTNYLTIVDYPNTNSEKFKQYWPANLHIIGKDILRFHVIYWPAFLMAADIAPPQRVFSHGWWTNQKEKISKSLGNVINPYEIVDLYGLDQVRYFLLREVPFGSDGDFSHNAVVQRINADLANNLGNLCQRVFSMIYKNAALNIPQTHEKTQKEIDLLDQVYQLLPKSRTYINEQNFFKMLNEIWDVIDQCNRHINEQAPWNLKKTNPTYMHVVLYTLAEALRNIGILLQPVMPQSMDNLLSQLKVPQDQRTMSHIGPEHALEFGLKLDKPESIFPRHDTIPQETVV